MTADILTTAQLAERLGMCRDTIWRWQFSDPRFAQCVIKRTRRSTYWSVARLLAAGLLVKPDTAPTCQLTLVK